MHGHRTHEVEITNVCLPGKHKDFTIIFLKINMFLGKVLMRNSKIAVLCHKW
jgi:hypothetical protein